nr:MAG TPA: hypothetical protein [Caudoviricetes sp.]
MIARERKFSAVVRHFTFSERRDKCGKCNRHFQARGRDSSDVRA